MTVGRGSGQVPCGGVGGEGEMRVLGVHGGGVGGLVG